MDPAQPSLPVLLELCTRFRAILASVPPPQRHASLKRFPHLSCGTTSELLGSYLHALGFGRFDYRHGSREGIASHAWIQQGTLIIDLTADQFGPHLPPVMVTRDSPWHAGFAPRRSYPIDIPASDEGALRPLWPFYQVLLALLPSLNGRAA
ncbi:MAG: hypothetical protein ABWY06_20260 [Pseudomonas sp.]|uniref:hypothetical protein n=1 Tax=Pseudomonas sp. TaxID=306 RepID=UPI0033983992